MKRHVGLKGKFWMAMGMLFVFMAAMARRFKINDIEETA